MRPPALQRRPSLIRERDCTPVGTFTIIRAAHPSFTDEHGKRRTGLVRRDRLPITLTDSRGEAVSYFELDMDQLPPEAS